VGFRQLGLFGLVEMAIFIGLVFVAYVYVWQRGGLDWGNAERPLAEGAEPKHEPVPEHVPEDVPEDAEDLARAG
jgi:hypothetical protein